MSSFADKPHYFFYDSLSFIMFSLILMNMIIREFANLVIM